MSPLNIDESPFADETAATSGYSACFTDAQKHTRAIGPANRASKATAAWGEELRRWEDDGGSL